MMKILPFLALTLWISSSYNLKDIATCSTIPYENISISQYDNTPRSEFLSDESINEMAIGDCVLAKISQYDYVNQEHQVWRWYLYSYFGHDENVICRLLRNIEKRFEAFLLRHRCRHHLENIYSCIIWDDLFISDVKLKRSLIFWHFQTGRHFEAATKFFTGSDTGIWIC